ncbi:diacylglycerol kinase family protein [Brooklawnia cerclae]|uniref:Diacylglycerol kinase family enzyme n=1 Tax=Brooklawnia cerclae TaxID=349934 RepID=A0ABX0SLS0_9ACTN|nr:diacylglycerol kinase family enzyme [Brooklawnia cerclae]
MSTTGHSGTREASAPRPKPPRNVAIIGNPIARDSGRCVTAVVRECCRLGLPVLSNLTTSVSDPGYGQARRAVAAGADLVVVVGGDGTIRQVVRALAGTQVALGVIACGTGNLLAHNLGLPRRGAHDQAAAVIGGSVVRIDVGWASGESTHGPWGEEPFVTMAGIGRDARTVACTGLSDKRRLGWWAYGVSGLAEARRRALPMRVQIDDEEPRDVLTWTVLVGNTPAGPGRIRIWPHARPDDGVLDVLEVPIRHMGEWLAVADKGLVHYDREARALRYAQGRRIAVHPSWPLPVQLDGDVVQGVTELRVRVEHRGLAVCVPRSGPA